MTDIQEKDDIFNELVKQYGPKILALAYKLAGNYADSEDIAQDVLVKAYTKFGQFKPGTNLQAWLYKITVNVYRDYARYRKRRKAGAHVGIEEVDTHENVCSPQTGTLLNTEKVAEQNEQNGIVLQMMDKLGTEHKVVVVLRVMEHRPYEEIAKILGCPIGTVKSRMFYACETLREMLKKSGNL